MESVLSMLLHNLQEVKKKDEHFDKFTCSILIM